MDLTYLKDLLYNKLLTPEQANQVKPEMDKMIETLQNVLQNNPKVQEKKNRDG